MIEDVAATVARLKTLADQRRAQAMRATAAREQAEAAVAQAVQALRSEFGVETPEQARAMREDLDRQIAAEQATVEQGLAGGLVQG